MTFFNMEGQPYKLKFDMEADDLDKTAEPVKTISRKYTVFTAFCR